MVLYRGVFASCRIDPSQDVEGLSHFPQPNSQKDGKKQCMRDLQVGCPQERANGQWLSSAHLG